MEKIPLRVLILEDKPSDAELMIYELQHAGFESKWERVESESDYLVQLQRPFDIILSDYTMPQFDAVRALNLLKEQGVDIPFIVVTGSISEEVAVECIKQGASDYLLKDRLVRLGPAVVRVLDQKRLRDENRRAEEALRESEKRYRSLFENMLGGYAYCRMLYENGQPCDFVYLDVNSAFEKLTGLKNVVGRRVSEVIPNIRELHPELLEIYGRTALTGKPEKFEIYLESLEAWLSISVYSTQQGYFIAVFDNITERKKAEEAIWKSEAKYRKLHESMMDGFVFVSMDGMIKECNESYREMLGYAPGELLKLTYRDLTPEKWHASEKIIEQQILRRGYSEVYEKEYRKKNGTIFPVELRAILIKDETNTNIGMWAIVRDITERKEAEAALRQSEEKFRELYDHAPVGYHEYDSEGRITSVNRTDLEMLGYTAEEMIGQPVWKFNADEKAREQILSKLSGTLPPGQNIERTYRRKDGTTFPVLCQDRLILDEKGKIKGIRCTIQDITERKRAEQALLESQVRYRTLFESSPLPKYLYNRETLAILAVNDAWVEHYGYSREDLLSMTLRDLYPPEELRRLAAFYASDLPMHYHDIWKHRKKDGTLIDVEIYGHGVNLGGQNLRIGVVRDITESKRAGDALRESEQRFHAIFDSVNDVIIVQDLTTGVILDVNQRMCELYGIAREEALGLDIGVLGAGIPPYTRQDALEWMRKAVEEGPQQFEWHTKDKAGRLSWIEVHLRRATIGGEECLLETAQDITERKRAEKEKADLQEQLRQSQKMEGIGRLAGGIAHDFNNLLTVIRGYSQLSLIELQKGDPLWENIEEIRQAGDRASDLTRQLLAFSRRQILEFKTLDLNQLTQGMEKMLRRMIGEDIELMIYPGEDLGSIRTDPGQMEQVIMNLVVNARDAMPSGGKLILETDNVCLNEEYARNHISVKPGPYVRLSITDTGCGMTPEVREQVFDPFFTTKEKGKGTGLGLSMVYGIVKQSDGNIWVYSEPGKGTTFKIYLPRMDEQVEVLIKKGELKEIPRGNETVLVVEDEEVVRKLAVQILKKQGYEVLQAALGGEALLVLERHPGPIHLILTDVVMPGMSGPELIERLRQVRQDFKVLYMSGYTDESVVYHGVRDGETNFIQKPFTLEMLGRRVREVLDKTGRG